MSYDIIGDIHGCYDTLKLLLEKLGYTQTTNGFKHPKRNTLFLGDLIDRGPKQLEVVDTVRDMVDSGQAQCLMGNHELNAIAFATPDPRGGYLRRHSERNINTHKAFLDAVSGNEERYADVISWFRYLPMWIDLGELRGIHACWSQEDMDRIQQQYGDKLTDELLIASADPDRWEYHAMEVLLKGKEIRLQDSQTFTDPSGIVRRRIRVRWWDDTALTYRATFMGPEAYRPHISNDVIEEDHLIHYPPEQPPLFIGHYWLEGDPEPLAPNISCLDYSIARPDGKLCAYRWDGETTLSADKFVTVPKLES